MSDSTRGSDGQAAAFALEDVLGAEPIAAFLAWYADAEQAEEPKPDAFCLATASADASPSARMVLLKSTDSQGFVFFTNKESRKGSELRDNPRATAVFFWPSVARQVRVEGRVEHVSDAEADEYFASRPRDSQLGAWASHQSSVISSREALLARAAEAAAQFPGAVPRPPYWGGYRLVPESIEFWRADPHRLNDRVVYRRGLGSGWERVRLAP